MAAFSNSPSSGPCSPATRTQNSSPNPSCFWQYAALDSPYIVVALSKRGTQNAQCRNKRAVCNHPAARQSQLRGSHRLVGVLCVAAEQQLLAQRWVLLLLAEHGVAAAAAAPQLPCLMLPFFPAVAPPDLPLPYLHHIEDAH